MTSNSTKLPTKWQTPLIQNTPKYWKLFNANCVAFKEQKQNTTDYTFIFSLISNFMGIFSIIDGVI